MLKINSIFLRTILLYLFNNNASITQKYRLYCKNHYPKANTTSLESIRNSTEEYVIKQFFCQFYNISDFFSKFQEMQELLFCRLKKMTLLPAVHRVYLLTIFCWLKGPRLILLSYFEFNFIFVVYLRVELVNISNLAFFL